MDSQRRPVMFIAIFLSFFLQSPNQIKAETTAASPLSSLVQGICEKTKNPTFCIKTLQSDRRTSEAKTVLSVAKIALDLAIKNSNQSRDFINGLVNSYKTKPEFKPALKECVADYNLTSFSFRSAYSEVEEGEYETANYDTLTVLDNVEYCETALSNAKVKIKSVSDALQTTRYFSNIGDTVTSILWNSEPPSSD